MVHNQTVMCGKKRIQIMFKKMSNRSLSGNELKGQSSLFLNMFINAISDFNQNVFRKNAVYYKQHEMDD